MNAAATRLALVVEPDPEVRELYGSVLRPILTEIEYADDGRDGLAKAIGQKPAVVITETRLAFINGYTLCSLLRQDPITANAAIIVVTVDANPSEVNRALASGADRVLAKPCAADALFSLITGIRDGHRIAPARFERTPTRTGADCHTCGDQTERAQRLLRAAHRRFTTSTPQSDPPPLLCPSCDQRLRYVRSHIGGVSIRLSEQWDYYVCVNMCGSYQYRQRTRRLRRIA